MIYLSQTQVSASLLVILLGFFAAHSYVYSSRELLRATGVLLTLYLVVVIGTTPLLAFCSAPIQLKPVDFCSPSDIERIRFLGLGKYLESLVAGTSLLIPVTGIFLAALRRASLEHSLKTRSHLLILHRIHLAVSPILLLVFPMALLPESQAIVALTFADMDANCQGQIPSFTWQLLGLALIAPILAWLRIAQLSKKEVEHTSERILGLAGMAVMILCLITSVWILSWIKSPMHEVLYTPTHLLLQVIPGVATSVNLFVLLVGLTYSWGELRRMR